MSGYEVIFPDGQTLELPAATAAAIEYARSKYTEPLWLHREERVLKLGGHQWIVPAGVGAARALSTQHPAEVVATAWKLFNRDWSAAAESYWHDTQRYPNHPRHFGPGVIPLVDEDCASKQIGWVRIRQVTAMDSNYAVFVQFALLALFDARSLPAEYA